MGEQQFKTVLSALAEKIESQNVTIYCKDIEIAELKKKLEEAEAHLPSKTTLKTADKEGA